MVDPIPLNQLLTHLSSALRSQTNAILEVRQQIGVVLERLERILDAQRGNDRDTSQILDDIREIRQGVGNTHDRLTSQGHEVNKKLDEITGKHIIPSERELRALTPPKPTFLEALGVVVKNIKDHWPHITVSGGVGATVYHLIQRFLQH